MYRIIFKLGPFTLYSYGLMMAIAFIAAIIVEVQLAKTKNIEKERIFDFSTYIIVAAIIGARLWFVIENFDLFENDILGIIRIWEGGMVFYGGFLGGVIGGLFFTYKYKYPVRIMADISAPAFALGIVFGRIGCFLNGCCYGKVCNSFGVTFPSKNYPPAYFEQLRDGLIEHTATHSLPVIPTQLIASFIALIIFFILIFIYKKKLFDGIVFSIFLILYSLDRFFVDFLRYYSPHAKQFAILSLSQITSIIIFIIGIFLFVFYYKTYRAKT